MNLEAIRQALMSHLDAGFDSAPVAAPNMDFTPPAGPWVRAEFEPGETFGAERGPSPASFRTGQLRLSVYAPENSGLATGLRLAGELEALFRLASPGGVICGDPWTKTIPAGADDDDEVQGYRRLEVRTPWQCLVEAEGAGA